MTTLIIFFALLFFGICSLCPLLVTDETRHIVWLER